MSGPNDTRKEMVGYEKDYRENISLIDEYSPSDMYSKQRTNGASI
jgi:hypothetical protein